MSARSCAAMLAVLSAVASSTWAVTVAVTPTTSTVLPGGVRSVYARVDGDPNTAVTWSTTGGTLANGIGFSTWTAPAIPGTFTVTATSTADPGQKATTTFTVIPAPTIRASNIPSQATIFRGQPLVVQSIIWGSTNTGVSWSSSGGRLAGSGREVVFSADASGTYTVTATSAADGTKSATTTVVVTKNAWPAASRPTGTLPVDCTHTGSGTVYEVTSSAGFDGVPWAALGPGDTVRIHHSGSPYYRQMLLSRSGTAAQPIRICGVPDGAGNLPELNGTNATAYAGAAFGTGAGNVQPLGGIIVYNYGAPYYGGTDSYPHDIVVEGLRISGFNHGNAYTDVSTGQVTPYDYFAACIRIQRGASITLRGNEIDHCGNGIFTASNSGIESHVTRNLLVEGNHLHDNGNVGRYGEHQCYLQALGLVVQGNYLATSLPGSSGGQLKTRSVQQFLRYNLIERGARIFDVVEVQDTQPLVFPWIGLDAGELPYTSPSDVVANFEAYQDHYIYGNIVHNTGANAALWVVHGAADSLGQEFNPGGMLNFYFNTVYTDVGWGSGLVDLGPYQTAITANTVWPTAYLQNNAIFVNSTLSGTEPYFYWNRYEADRVVLGRNWITSNWGTGNPGGGPLTGIANAKVPDANVWQAGQLSTQVTGIANLITGVELPFDANTYIPSASGPLAGTSEALPPSIAALPPLMSYSPATHLMVVRSDTRDIGAVGLDSSSAVNGSCGRSNRTYVAAPPAAGLCTTGAASGVGGNGPWTWSCSGSNGGTSASCIAGTFTINEYPVSSASNPVRITAGPDGNLWFTEASSNHIGRMSTTGVLAEFAITSPSGIPTGIAVGPDGNLWFIEQGANRIGRMTTGGTMVAEHPITTAASNPGAIVTGPDNQVWFTERSGNRIARITTAGIVTEFPITGTAGSYPSGIAAGPDGNLWFTELLGNRIGRITPAGTIAEYPVSTPGSQPFGIAAGPDGHLWFTEQGGNRIGRISTSGVVTEFLVETAASQPFAITAGPDGNLWFTELSGNRIGRITPSGVVTEFAIPTPASQPSGIAPGPDGNIWFTEQVGNRIGQLVLASIAEAFDLTVARQGDGNGSVTATPGTTRIGMGTYASGTVVTLTAIPDAGAAFAGWTGACSGVTSCVVTMNAAKAVTATFVVGGGPAPGALSRSPATLDFGGQSVNTTSPAQFVTIANTGGSAVGISAITAAAPFSSAHDCGTTLAAGASCTVSVTFTPTAQGSVAAALAIAADTPVPDTTLSGVGERSLVTHYYRAILGRPPDGGGKAYWENVAASLPTWGASVNETWYSMAMTFYFSAEYLAMRRDDAGFVTDLYRTFFNRNPDDGGLAYWVGILSRGTPREVVLASFMFSDEFANFTEAIFGTDSVRAEVNVVMDFYRGLLARLPDKGGFDFWLAQIRAAQCGGAAAANAVRSVVDAISQQFLGSDEYVRRGRSNAQFVGDLYNAFLRRGGDEAGVAHWIGQLDRGANTREEERAAFLGSVEFATRVNAVIAEACVR